MGIEHVNPEGMIKNPAFSQAITVSGARRTIYIGGQNAVDGDGRIVGEGDVGEQSAQVARNLLKVLDATGASPDDLVKLTIFVVTGHDARAGFAGFHQVFGEAPNPPTISVVFVAGLARPEFLIEVGGVAEVVVD